MSDTKPVDFIYAQEGHKETVYIDSAGIPTLGAGYALVMKDGKGGWQARNFKDIQAVLKTAKIPFTAKDFDAVETMTQNLNAAGKNPNNTAKAKLLTQQGKALSGFQKNGDLAFTVNKGQALTILPHSIEEAKGNLKARLTKHLDTKVDEDGKRVSLGTTKGATVYDRLVETPRMTPLISMALNSPETIGPKIAKALDYDEAGFEIGYGTNPADANGHRVLGHGDRRFREQGAFDQAP